MTSIKIPAELITTAPIVLSPIELSTNSIFTALSIMTPTKKSTKPINKNKHPNFIIY